MLEPVQTGRRFRIAHFLLLFACALLSTVTVAQEPTSYEIGIAGYSFDPASTAFLSDPERISAAELETYEAEGNHYLVQLHQPIEPSLAERLRENYGLSLSEYIPERAYLEYLEPGVVDGLRADDAVRAVVPFEPRFKLSPNIGSMKSRAQSTERAAGVFVRLILFRRSEPGQVVEALRNLGATEIETSDERNAGGDYNIQFVLPDRAALDDVARLGGVRWIEEVPESDDDNGNTAGTMQSGAPANTPIWDIGIHGEGQTISVMEGGGANINHCMFNDPVNPVGPTHRKIGRVEAMTNGHAHFVAGIAAGDDINNLGTGANRGNAWAARLNFVRGRTSLNMFTQLGISALNGSFIHTNSWHGVNVNAMNQATYDLTSSQVDNFIWNNEEHVVLGSMGNIGEEQGPPGTAKNAIGINAGTTFPNTQNVGDGNAGPTAGGRRKPDVVTPGCNITSATFGAGCGMNTRGCATSWATPAAAAASTLIRQYYADGYYPGGDANPANVPPRISAALVKATLVNSARNMTGIAGYPSNMEGWGLVQLDNTLYFNGDDHLLRIAEFFNANGLTTGGSRNHSIEVGDNATPLVVTLAWSDPPAAAGAANPAVNNLNLRVISPDGTQTFRGNVFAGGVSTTGGAADTLNNVEQVFINDPALGQWTIAVDAQAVNVGAPGQGYAVVARAARAPLIPEIQLPGDVHFDATCAGSSASESLSVCNGGNATLEVSGISSSDPQFSVTTPSGGYPVNIGAGACFPFQVNFSPAGAGPQSATLDIQSNDPDTPLAQVMAHGEGTVADIQATGSTAYGFVSAWSSGERDLAVCNVGSCPLQVTAASVDCPDFTVDDGALPTTLDAAACMDLTTRFTPTVPGPHQCTLTVNSDDPDTPALTRELTARTPPAFSIHSGISDPHGGLGSTQDDGATLNLDFVHDVSDHVAWDLRLGVSELDGLGSNPDMDILTFLGNARYTFNPADPVRLFINGGGGLYHFDPGDTELGLNLGLGLRIPLSPRFSLEATYNYHNALTASPDLEFDRLQAGLLISF